MNQTEITLLAASILKSSLGLRSFVVEEASLAQLLASSWKPIGDKVRKQIAPVIYPKKGVFDQDKALAFESWLTPDMFQQELEAQWASIENRVNFYLSRAYRRAFKEKGEEFPESVEKADDFAPADDHWGDTWDDFSGEGSTLDAASGKYAGESAITSPLLKLVKAGFLAYATSTAIPAVMETVDLLRRLETAEKDLLAGLGNKPKKRGISLRFSADTPQEAREAFQQIPAVRDSVKTRLADLLEGNARASMLANLSVARAYNFGFLDYAEREGIQYYKISSILDGKVCASCLTMNGKIFSIADARDYKKKFLSVVGDTEQMKQVTPFLTQDAATQITDAEGVVSSAGRDYFPPLHAHCRCRAIVVSAGDVPAQKAAWKAPICKVVEVTMPRVC